MGVGGKGRPAAPTALKLVKGTRKDRINTSEPQPADAEVVPPAWLGDEAREIWAQYAPDLKAKGVLTAWDVEAFGVWCDAAARRREAVAKLAEEGAVVQAPVFNKNGDRTGERLTRNPWVLVLREATDTLARYGARFGLSPSDRAGLKVARQGQRRPADRLLT